MNTVLAITKPAAFVLAISILLGGCDGGEYSPSTEAASGDAPGYGDVRGETAEQIPMGTDHALSTEHRVVENLENKMQALQRDIGRLTYRLQTNPQTVHLESSRELDALRAKYSAAAAELAALKGAVGSDKFDEKRSEFESSWEALQQAYNQAVDNVNMETEGQG